MRGFARPTFFIVTPGARVSELSDGVEHLASGLKDKASAERAISDEIQADR